MLLCLWSPGCQGLGWLGWMETNHSFDWEQCSALSIEAIALNHVLTCLLVFTQVF